MGRRLDHDRDHCLAIQIFIRYRRFASVDNEHVANESRVQSPAEAVEHVHDPHREWHGRCGLRSNHSHNRGHGRHVHPHGGADCHEAHGRVHRRVRLPRSAEDGEDAVDRDNDADEKGGDENLHHVALVSRPAVEEVVEEHPRDDPQHGRSEKRQHVVDGDGVEHDGVAIHEEQETWHHRHVARAVVPVHPTEVRQQRDPHH
ncbi:hypothetical protein ON010_g12000 [Phytophthora cinnamomi]|nr:hypothetical protein ON010_g12000 [Phytophthora cinnamomi]